MSPQTTYGQDYSLLTESARFLFLEDAPAINDGYHVSTPCYGVPPEFQVTTEALSEDYDETCSYCKKSAIGYAIYEDDEIGRAYLRWQLTVLVAAPDGWVYAACEQCSYILTASPADLI